jgi:hypothetical protein
MVAQINAVLPRPIFTDDKAGYGDGFFYPGLKRIASLSNVNHPTLTGEAKNACPVF